MRYSWCAPLVVLAVLPMSANGWGRDGHRIVGAIAARHLTPATQAAVQELLGQASLAQVSTWADEIKSDSSWRWANPLHYANVRPGAERFELHRDCAAEGCVVSAILRYALVLRDASATRQERIEALKFLVHFVGDVHQPLHVSHARDRGGNDIRVSFFHDNTNLHRVWDSGLIRRAKRPWAQWANHSQLPDPLPPHWNTLSVTTWASETYRLAVSHAYDVPRNGQLGQAYFERCLPVIEEQLTLGGYRLALLLNRLFDPDRPLPADFVAERPPAGVTVTARLIDIRPLGPDWIAAFRLRDNAAGYCSMVLHSGADDPREAALLHHILSERVGLRQPPAAVVVRLRIGADGQPDPTSWAAVTPPDAGPATDDRN